jgi:hypothetical protein
VSSRCILVTGSRDWANAWSLKAILDQAAAEAAADAVTHLIVRHGACYPRHDPDLGRRPFRSADYLAHLWIARFAATQPVRIVEQARPARWQAPCRPDCDNKPTRVRPRGHRTHGGLTCPQAGLHRNVDMIREEPTPYAGYAFWDGSSAGTRHCIRKLREFSVPVHLADAPGLNLDTPCGQQVEMRYEADNRQDS